MNWKSLQLSACALAASLAVASCSKEKVRDVAGEVARDQYVKINLNLGIEDLTPELEKEGLRLSVVNRDKVNGKYNGVRFVFDTLANDGQGEKVKLHTYFRQGNTIKVGTPIDVAIKGMKSLGDTNRPVWSGLGELSVPAGIDLTSSEDIYVAGAIGVEGIDADGKAIIEPAEVAIDAEDSTVETTVPMYFPEIKLDKSNVTLSEPAHLRFYGALVEIELKNNMHEPLLLSQVVMRTEAFTSKGSMLLRTATETNTPDWEPVEYPSSWSDGPSRDQKISFASDRLDKDGVKRTFLWVKPSDFSGTRSLKLWVREGSYTYKPEERNEAIAKSYKVKKLETKVYRLPIEAIPNPSLIYTEHRRQALNFLWEVYNPTKKRIYLRDFYHNRLKWSTNRLDVMHSTRLTDGGSNALAVAYDKRNGGLRKKSPIIYANYVKQNRLPQDMYLEPGEMIVYAAFGSDYNHIREISQRGNVAYIVYFAADNPAAFRNAFVGDADYRDMYVLSKGSPVQQVGLKVDRENVVDSFFYFEDASVRRRTNEVNYVRRPDRTFGRKYWAPREDGPNCDWVYRTLNSRDHGYRFSWYYSPGVKNGGLPVKSQDAGNFYVYLNHGGISYSAFQIPKIWTKDLAETH